MFCTETERRLNEAFWLEDARGYFMHVFLVTRLYIMFNQEFVKEYMISFNGFQCFGNSMYLIIFQVSCKGETNECHNGGTAIWDPIKPYSCQCKVGYEGDFCEKGIHNR